MNDITTLGVKLGYAVETVAGTKPTAFTWLERCKSIGGVDLTTEQINVSALEDLISKYRSGRQDTGGTWDVVFGMGDDVITQLKTAMEASAAAKKKGLSTWFEVWFPDLSSANSGFYVIAEFGSGIPFSEIAQNSAAEISMSMTLNDYKGPDAGIEPTASGG